MDLVIGKKSANVSYVAKKVGKEAKTITKTLRHLQSVDKLIYSVNIKSITTDNGSEFYD